VSAVTKWKGKPKSARELWGVISTGIRLDTRVTRNAPTTIVNPKLRS
jgi:hypothetical protein